MKIAEKWDRDGFVIIENFFTPEECRKVTAEAGQLVRDFDPEEASTIFSTTRPQEERDAYFLQSGDKIRFFWEEEAFLPDGTRRLSKENGINKIGHALHDLNPVFREFSRSPQVKNLLMNQLGWKDPLIIQSMFIFKHSRVGGEVGWHQDQTYLYSEAGPVLGFWVALEEANRQNGCLWAIPGGHRGPLRKRFIRKNQSTSTEVLDRTPWEEEKQIPLEVPQGSVILLHGLLPHRSDKNHSTVSRQAFTLHFMERHWPYPEDNWLQRGKDLPFRGF